MKIIDESEAKKKLSHLLKCVAGGEEVIISKDGSPVARIVAVASRSGKRVLGSEKGRFKIPENFDAPLPKELLDLFNK